MVRGVEQQGGAAMESSPSSLSPTSPVSAHAGQAAMTVIGIATVAAALIVFLALTLVVLLHFYCDQWRRAVTTSTSGRGRRRSGSGGDGGRGGGVDPEVLLSLPVTVYSHAAAAAKEDGGVECAVCLAELEDGEEARFLPRCGHGFHAECVDLWLGSHSTCPLCRLTTVVKPDVQPPLLPPVPREPPASYTVNLPASVLLGLSDHGAGAVTMT